MQMDQAVQHEHSHLPGCGGPASQALCPVCVATAMPAAREKAGARVNAARASENET